MLRDHREDEPPTVLDEASIDPGIVLLDVGRRVRDVELDRPATAGLQIDEASAELRAQDVADVRLTVQELVWCATLEHRSLQVTKRRPEEVAIRGGEHTGPGDVLRVIPDAIGEVHRRHLDRPHAFVKPLERSPEGFGSDTGRNRLVVRPEADLEAVHLVDDRVDSGIQRRNRACRRHEAAGDLDLESSESHRCRRDAGEHIARKQAHRELVRVAEQRRVLDAEPESDRDLTCRGDRTSNVRRLHDSILTSHPPDRALDGRATSRVGPTRVKRALLVVVAMLIGLSAPADASDGEPVVTAGGISGGVAVDHDGDRVVFTSATRNIDPLVDPRAPHGTYLWTPTSLGRVEQIGSLALDISADGRTALTTEVHSGFSGTFLQTWVFSVDANVGRELVSVSTDGEEGNSSSAGGGISGDGRYVAFSSSATNLSGGSPGVFVRDRTARTTTLIEPDAYGAALSDDGRTVAYTVPDEGVVVRDLPDGPREVVSGPFGSNIDLSADGRVVVFDEYFEESDSTSVFVHDRTTDTTTVLPGAYRPTISADGTRIAFDRGQPGPQHVYVRDLVSGEETLVSRTGDGAPGNGGNVFGHISGDGTKVVFESHSRDLGTGVVHAPLGGDLFLADLDTGDVTLLTVARDAGMHQLRTDGYVNSYGAAQPRTPQPRLDGAVALAVPTFMNGFWVTSSSGRVARAGFARHHGEVTTPLARPVVDIASSRSGEGYWLAASDGGVFSFGDAEFHGSTGAMRLNQPIVGMVPTPSGDGYWLVARDGGVFSFGDARFRGSTGAIRLNQPIVGMARTPTGDGYWLVASDGGVFAFGDARFHGSTGAIRLNQPIVSMVRTYTGDGYRLVARDGGVFAFGDASHILGPSDPRCDSICIVDAAST
jgi:Tol biopolymer transport system component